MNFKQIKIDLESALNTFWGSTSPILWENTDQSAIDTATFYIVPQVVPADATQIEYGTDGLINVVGNFSIKLICNISIGTGAILTHADSLNNYFSNRWFGKTHTDTGKMITLGIIENKYHIVVLVPFNCYQKTR